MSIAFKGIEFITYRCAVSISPVNESVGAATIQRGIVVKFHNKDGSTFALVVFNFPNRYPGDMTMEVLKQGRSAGRTSKASHRQAVEYIAGVCGGDVSYVDVAMRLANARNFIPF